ncbi:ATP-binding protein [Tsukamurella sp. 8F]|uniref:ATP-binding protein n=1 Tax=unclassified Tsukamurella TaxID=2633480 RepID=UPI0023BA2165|nr:MULTISPECIES: ATP-binding protein [unclassified Tsukamurella]MDF0531123.1 ATP-binding protein [Tsukamurella sp. 8J]MDF0588369.1 ATP-binding protein [Tsukamurella sp. 8F]
MSTTTERGFAASDLLTRPTVIGNLRFARHGIFAEFLLSGLEYARRPRAVQERAAQRHEAMVSALPSGFWLSGLTAPMDTTGMILRMLDGYRDRAAWVSECRRWEPILDGLSASDRLFWLSVPVDHGTEGLTALGRTQKALDVIRGRDVDTASSVAEYIALGDEFAAALPSELAPVPVTPELVYWHWMHTVGRGGQRVSLPESLGLERLDAEDFPKIRLDEGDQAHHGRRFPPSRWPGARLETGGLADSFQSALTVTSFSERGIAFPGSEIFAVCDDERLPGATVDWMQYVTKTPAEQAARHYAWVDKNLSDQQDQQGRQAQVDDSLARKRVSAGELTSALTASQHGFQANMTGYVVVSGANRRVVRSAVKSLSRSYQDIGVRVDAWSGPQARFLAASLPGNVKPRAAETLSHPTTPEDWAKTVPVLSGQLGNASGVPLGRAVSTALNPPVFLDMSGASRRRHSAVLVLGGDPGGGKSYTGKRIAKSEVRRGSQAVVMDPGVEWHLAFEDTPGAVFVDLAHADVSTDVLRLFPTEIAGTVAANHVLPLLGLEPMSTYGSRFRVAVSPQVRERERIRSMPELLSYLERTYGAGDELVTRLMSWASEPTLQSVFDDSLSVPNFGAAPVVVWKTGRLDLQDVDSADALETMTTTQQAGRMLYGLAAALAEQTFYERPHQFGFLVTEEDKQWLSTPGGRRTAHLLTRRGRRTRSGWISITQNGPDDHAGMGDEFIHQKILFRTKDDDLSKAHLRWLGIDPDEYPEVLEDYRYNTSPEDLRAAPAGLGGGMSVEQHGRPQLGREGEAYMVDEFGRTGKIQVFSAPDPADREAFDTDPASLERFEGELARGIR